jgi:hypothetical protein
LISYLIWGHSLRDYPPGYPYGLVVEFKCCCRFRLEGKTSGGGSPGGLPLMLRFSRLQVANLADPRLTSPLGRNPLPRHPSVKDPEGPCAIFPKKISLCPHTSCSSPDGLIIHETQISYTCTLISCVPRSDPGAAAFSRIQPVHGIIRAVIMMTIAILKE